MVILKQYRETYKKAPITGTMFFALFGHKMIPIIPPITKNLLTYVPEETKPHIQPAPQPFKGVFSSGDTVSVFMNNDTQKDKNNKMVSETVFTFSSYNHDGSVFYVKSGTCVYSFETEKWGISGAIKPNQKPKKEKTVDEIGMETLREIVKAQEKLTRMFW